MKQARWSQAVYAAGWGVHTYIQPMGDGAVWIEEQASSCFPGSVFLLDLYHVCDYLDAAAPACTRKENPKRWLQRQKNKLLKGKKRTSDPRAGRQTRSDSRAG
ncbi:MAG TPA: hypothetical protein VK041_05320 [Opitutales bacterium]|nr:hypothetical protein [Opitutales bacterium]